MTSIEEEAALVLDRAVDIIHEGGWARSTFGDFEDPSVPHCAYGAILTAGYECKTRPWATTVAASALMAKLPSPISVPEGHQFERIFYWNDFLAKNPDEVVHKFKEVAESLR